MQVAERALPKSAAELEEVKAKAEQEEKRKVKEQERREKSLAALEKKGADAVEKAKAEYAKADKAREDRAKNKNQHPPLGDYLIQSSIDVLGVSEIGARLPFFFLALLVALATYFLGLRIRGPSAGALAVVVLLASPLFVFQARQLSSELGAMAGGTLMLFAAIGLTSPSQKPRPLYLPALDALLLILGASLCYYSSLTHYVAP